MDQAICIESDDPKLAGLVRELAGLVTGAGGYLHPQLRVVIERGQLRMESDAAGPEPLVRLPESCLLPIDGLDIQLHGGSLQLAAVPAGLDAQRQAMLACMLAIYNQGHKVASYRRELPWSAFAAAPALLELLHRARADAPKPTRLYELARSGDLDRLALQGFIDSRTLKYPFAGGSAQRVMMPFIDFFNHHAASPSFGRDGDALTVMPSRPVHGSAECFVCYNVLDAMDAYLNYGFADASAPFVRSVPLAIRLAGIGTLNVRGKVAPPRKQPLPLGLKDLGVFLPRCQRQAPDELNVAELLIPPAESAARLHRVLGVLIQQLAPDITQPELHAAVDAAVQQALAANQAYYRELAALLAGLRDSLEPTPALDQLQRLIASQQRRLDDFQQAISGGRLHGAAGAAFPYDFGHGLAWS